MEHTILVYGASGHGKVVADIVRALGLSLAGFIDDGVPVGTAVAGSTVVGPGSFLVGRGSTFVVALGVGINATRERLFARVKASGCALLTAVHPSAVVAPSATLGEGTVVMPGAVVNAEARVGRGAILNTRSVTEHECIVGDFAHLCPGSTLGGQAKLGARSQLGLNASVIHLGDVGDDVVVGAGACVVAPIAHGLTVVGVPARPLAR
jgi:sugar O-acyltransferase (sialic acid O-acetyltransferase NeuD family)